MARRVRVFISYAHDDVDHVVLVRRFRDFLHDVGGVDARLDLTAAERPRDWPAWVQEQVRAADFVLVVASPAYKVRAEDDAPAGSGRGVRWEVRLIRELSYADHLVGLAKVLPVVLPGRDVSEIPFWLGPTTRTHYAVREFTVAGAEALLRYVTGQPYEIDLEPAPVPILPPRRLGLRRDADPAGAPGPVLPMVPPPAAVAFLDRPALRAAVVSGLEPGTAGCGRVWVTGGAGCGKTQLALSVFGRLSGQVELALWVTASSRTAVVSAYAVAWRSIEPPDEAPNEATTAGGVDEFGDAGRFLGWLATTPRSWLVVLDGADRPEELDGLWPSGQQGTVVVTSQHPAAPQPSPAAVVEVGPFTVEESGRFLWQRLAGGPGFRAGGVEGWRDLAAALGGNPLGLSRAGAYLAVTGVDGRAYLRRLAGVLAGSAAGDGAGSPPDPERLTGAGLAVARALAEELLPLPGLAGRVLEVLAVLGPHGVPEALLTTPAVRAYASGGASSRAAVLGEGDIAEVVTGLHQAGVLRLGPDGQVWMHEADQARTLRGLDAARTRAVARVAGNALQQLWPQVAAGSALAADLRAHAAVLQRALSTPAPALAAAGYRELLPATPADAIAIWPVAIGHYTDPQLPDLDAEAQVGRLIDLLAPFGGRHHPWPAPARERGASATQQRLHAWATTGQPASGPSASAGSVLYWVGHGWQDELRAALAHADSPADVGAAGTTPEQLADVIRSHAQRTGGWTVVVIDTGYAARFVELVTAALKAHHPPQRVLLVGVHRGPGTPGRFTDALRTVLHTTYLGNGRIRLTDLAAQLPRLLPGCEVATVGDLTDAELVPVYPPVASWMSAPLDTIRHLEDVLDDLSPDERRHFLVKTQAAEHGELSWYFQGRHSERARITTWLRATGSGMLVVTGRAGSGKSALLGNVLVHALPDLRDALARRGLTTALPADQLPPDGVFDAVIHLSGLTLPQVTARLAAAAGLGALPSAADPDLGIAGDIDWLAEQLANRGRPFTVLADALDEAVDPLDTAGTVLARVAAQTGVRVVVGTRASTNETPDAPAEDTNLLDALTARAAATDQAAGVVWVERDPQAVAAYVTHRLRAARDHGRRQMAVPGIRAVTDTDIDRAAAAVAAQDREFLHARLAVYELIEEPTLLTVGRAGALAAVLRGDHQDLFGKALDRLGRLDDRYPVLLHALAHARGRGVPEADGIWATLACALAPTSEDQPDRTGWAGTITGLLRDCWVTGRVRSVL
jgi:hypothetical protein